jgi:transposase-like protein
MSAKKLSDADKLEIIEQYRHPGETTSTLAQRYGVSNSTISRLLKSSFSPQEYDQLVQQKRANRSGSRDRQSQRRKPILRDSSGPNEESATDSGEQLQLDLPKDHLAKDHSNRRRRKSVGSTAHSDSPVPEESESSPNSESRREIKTPENGHETADETDPWLTIEPLANALIPKTCYLVVDRSSELISRPLREFNDLGEIPAAEISSKTLPVFDNHRVARRFANRNQRVMKVPDSQVLQKTGPHLQAKGITRVFFDGQVYSL